MPFANVNNVTPRYLQEDSEFERQLNEAKTSNQVEHVLFCKIRDLEDELDALDAVQFRLVNLMSSKQLDAYDEIQRRLGPKASDQDWTQAIKEWKEAQP
jgi:hypothetical protein